MGKTGGGGRLRLQVMHRYEWLLVLHRQGLGVLASAGDEEGGGGGADVSLAEAQEEAGAPDP